MGSVTWISTCPLAVNLYFVGQLEPAADIGASDYIEGICVCICMYNM